MELIETVILAIIGGFLVHMIGYFITFFAVVPIVSPTIMVGNKMKDLGKKFFWAAPVFGGLLFSAFGYLWTAIVVQYGRGVEKYSENVHFMWVFWIAFFVAANAPIRVCWHMSASNSESDANVNLRECWAVFSLVPLVALLPSFWILAYCPSASRLFTSWIPFLYSH